MRPIKIISGGQTGADIGALRAARDLGIPTGGWCPAGWRTEKGPNPSLADFGLQQTVTAKYDERTWRNVAEADGTVIIGNLASAGCRLTIRFCRQQKKPWGGWHRVEPLQLQAFVDRFEIQVLNIAGNRASKSPGIEQRVYDLLMATWGVPGVVTYPLPETASNA